MARAKTQIALLLPLLFLVFVGIGNIAAKPPSPVYHIYAGNTHAHTAYTWSHGEQFPTNGCAGIRVYGNVPGDSGAYAWNDGYVKTNGKCSAMYVINSWQIPSSDLTLRPDWQQVQGPPSRHFELAKAAGFDFYAVSDHSQEAAFMEGGDNNPAWIATKREAAQATDTNFVALAGFEFSENNGPGGTGHLNVINSDGILNALEPGNDLAHFYKWLEAAKANGNGPIVASFNHPDAEQYNNWDYRDPQVTDIITLLEVINSNSQIHYDGFLNALDKGWKVSPVSGLDNHGLTGINKDSSRTFVLATAKTKAAILEAMKNRRTYASLDKNIQCHYTVNGSTMGSTLTRPDTLNFDISISDPDTDNPNDKITKIDIVTDGGTVAQAYNPDPGYSVEWKPLLHDTANKFFFVRVWNAGGGDVPNPNPANPIAWLAPVWTGR
jgi:hypothetical protein